MRMARPRSAHASQIGGAESETKASSASPPAISMRAHGHDAPGPPRRSTAPDRRAVETEAEISKPAVRPPNTRLWLQPVSGGNRLAEHAQSIEGRAPGDNLGDAEPLGSRASPGLRASFGSYLASALDRFLHPADPAAFAENPSTLTRRGADAHHTLDAGLARDPIFGKTEERKP